jgi:hypothetical protein
VAVAMTRASKKVSLGHFSRVSILRAETFRKPFGVTARKKPERQIGFGAKSTDRFHRRRGQVPG